MDRKQIPVLHFLLLAIISISFSAPIQYQTLLPTPLPKTLNLQTLSRPTQIQSSQPEHTLALNLYNVDHLHPPVNSTLESLFKLRLLRDAARVQKLSDVAGGGGFSTSVTWDESAYITRIGVGTPVNYFNMILDTGSDVVWLQCLPCQECYNQADPLFNPKNSTSFGAVECDNPLCHQLESPKCNRRNECLYNASYGDGSFTTGELSTETLTFGDTQVPNITIGCGHDNDGSFGSDVAGMLGLGRGKLSFPTQTVGQFGKKFSYCLATWSVSVNSSSLIFGESAIPEDSIFTPLRTNPLINVYYYVELIGISVGGKPVSGIDASLFKLDVSTGEGGVIVDSGTTITRLTQPAYVALRDAFLAGVSNLTRASSLSILDTCFNLSGNSNVSVPAVVLHFNGADLSLPTSNYLIPVDSDGKYCFAFAGTVSHLSIIGNVQQQGFWVGFDLANNRVGFAPEGCT